MPGICFIDDDAPDPCDLSRDARQRRDDEADAAALIAFGDGQRAGLLGVAAGANPHPVGTLTYGEWERGRSNAEARKRSRELQERARVAVCVPCTCGGRGLCRDAA